MAKAKVQASNLAFKNSNPAVDIDLVKTKKAAQVYRAMNHKLRQTILKLIDEKKDMTVTQIYVKLKLEQSVASQHLAILRRAGFVNTARTGKFIHYSVNYERFKSAIGAADILL